jgi:hypothetical protein
MNRRAIVAGIVCVPVCADERMKKSEAIYNVQEAVSCAPTTHTTHDIKKNNEQKQQHKKQRDNNSFDL